MELRQEINEKRQLMERLEKDPEFRESYCAQREVQQALDLVADLQGPGVTETEPVENVPDALPEKGQKIIYIRQAGDIHIHLHF